MGPNQTSVGEWSNPDLLDVQLGANWGNWMLSDGRILQVSGPVVMRYSHAHPDMVQFIFTKVTMSVAGGIELIPADIRHAVDAGF